MTNQVFAAISVAENLALNAREKLAERRAATSFFVTAEPGGCPATPYVIMHGTVVVACAERISRARAIADEINAIGYPHRYEYQLFAAAALLGRNGPIDAASEASTRDALRCAARVLYLRHAPDGSLSFGEAMPALVDVIDEYGIEPEQRVLLDAIEYVAAEIVKAHVGERLLRARASFQVVKSAINELRNA